MGGRVSQRSNLLTLQRSIVQPIYPFSFHTVAHPFAQWAQVNSCGISTFHTLSTAMGGRGVPLLEVFKSYLDYSAALGCRPKKEERPGLWALLAPRLTTATGWGYWSNLNEMVMIIWTAMGMSFK